MAINPALRKVAAKGIMEKFTTVHVDVVGRPAREAKEITNISVNQQYAETTFGVLGGGRHKRSTREGYDITLTELIGAGGDFWESVETASDKGEDVTMSLTFTTSDPKVVRKIGGRTVRYDDVEFISRTGYEDADYSSTNQKTGNINLFAPPHAKVILENFRD